jgi:hypothetical protein
MWGQPPFGKLRAGSRLSGGPAVLSFMYHDRCGYHGPMRYTFRFLWNATKGHRLAPWRSPYLLWRIETYCGVKMTQIGFLEFWEFVWRERSNLWRFLKWTAEMERYVHPKPQSP